MTQGYPHSRIEWITRNENGEAETVKVLLKDEPGPDGRRPRSREVYVDFTDLAIKRKESMGNLVTKYAVQSVTFEKKGRATLEGRKVWFDRDVLRLNYEGRGELLGEFADDDAVLVITRNGEFYTTTYADSNHYDDDILRIEKFDPNKVWTLALDDKTLGYPYLKRFLFEISPKRQRFVGADEQSELLLLSDTPYARMRLTFGGHDATRPAVEIEADDFIGVKSFKAKGKRLTTYTLESIEELDPTRVPEPVVEESEAEPDETAESEDEEIKDEKPIIIEGDLFAGEEEF